MQGHEQALVHRDSLQLWVGHYMDNCPPPEENALVKGNLVKFQPASGPDDWQYRWLFLRMLATVHLQLVWGAMWYCPAHVLTFLWLRVARAHVVSCQGFWWSHLTDWSHASCLVQKAVLLVGQERTTPTERKFEL